jgi:uncharacterized DUF497 family protein
MDFDWSIFKAEEASQDEIAESIEDPFSLKFLPDSGPIADQSRFFSLGKSISGKGVFTIYRSTGKVITVIAGRPMTEEEDYYYTRRMRESM